MTMNKMTKTTTQNAVPELDAVGAVELKNVAMAAFAKGDNQLVWKGITFNCQTAYGSTYVPVISVKGENGFVKTAKTVAMKMLFTRFTFRGIKFAFSFMAMNPTAYKDEKDMFWAKCLRLGSFDPETGTKVDTKTHADYGIFNRDLEFVRASEPINLIDWNEIPVKDEPAVDFGDDFGQNA